ncbi:MAG: amidase [Phycisphaerales bacterium]|nr:amidase [Phycisphaerales bacterium]
MPCTLIIGAVLCGLLNSDIETITTAMDRGETSSEKLTQFYIVRAEAIDAGEQGLHCILANNPNAIADAIRLDAQRARGSVKGPLHGVPILIKDNIETRELPTTAGSLALVNNRTGRDATVVQRLRDAGAVILGKANLSEWANIRSPKSSSGWSAVGGLTRNPYNRDRSACGSSSGSGAAVAADLVTAAIGTETDGSVTCPAAMNGLVGLKPTVGLVPRTHIVPISHSQDTAGPMTRTVKDAAIMLTVMAGSDPLDAASASADLHKMDYTGALDSNALKNSRLGVLWFHTDWCSPEQLTAFEQQLEALQKAGAVLVDIRAFPDMETIYTDEMAVLLHELRSDMAVYLNSLPGEDHPRTLNDIIAFNRTHAEREMPHFGQEFFEMAVSTDTTSELQYAEAHARAHAAAGPNGIDRLLAEHNLTALIAPTTGPAFEITLGEGDAFAGGSTTLPAVAGYPHLTVPAGMVDELPVGLSFIGPAWSEAKLLALGYAFEQLKQWRTPPTLH